MNIFSHYAREAELWCRYIAIQLVSLPLMIVGVPLCAIGVVFMRYSLYQDRYYFPGWLWLWDNDEDGVLPRWYQCVHASRGRRFNAFIWTAFRNPVNNLRFVPGVSVPGGPYRVYTYKGFYVHFGYCPTEGWPVLSCGRL